MKWPYFFIYFFLIDIDSVDPLHSQSTHLCHARKIGGRNYLFGGGGRWKAGGVCVRVRVWRGALDDWTATETPVGGNHTSSTMEPHVLARPPSPLSRARAREETSDPKGLCAVNAIDP